MATLSLAGIAGESKGNVSGGASDSEIAARRAEAMIELLMLPEEELQPMKSNKTGMEEWSVESLLEAQELRKAGDMDGFDRLMESISLAVQLAPQQ